MRPLSRSLAIATAAIAVLAVPAVAIKSPTPSNASGSGARILDLTLPRSSPVVVTASHTGSSNFVVKLVPRGGGSEELLVNTIGNYSGKTLAPEASKGRYRVQVEAGGRWSLRFQQPRPTGGAKVLPAVIQGRGDTVVAVHANEGFQAVVSGAHRGESNFAVHLTGYGNTSGRELLFNEIGTYRGETLVDLPKGGSLLSVQADGSWSVRFKK